MITRAQAEALLTLAESLEACERLNMNILVTTAQHLEIDYIDGLSGEEVRKVVNENIPGGKFTANLIQKNFPNPEDKT